MHQEIKKNEGKISNFNLKKENEDNSLEVIEDKIQKNNAIEQEKLIDISKKN